MTSELASRLRQYREAVRLRGADPDDANLFIKAADRIDELEAALRKVRDLPPGRCAEDDANNWLESRGIAREALEASS